jgi:hypothetical protein
MYVGYADTMKPIDFGMQRSKVKVAAVDFVKTLASAITSSVLA